MNDMSNPHYKEKWFQALVLFCLSFSVLTSITPRPDLANPANEAEQISATIKNAMPWIAGFGLFAYYYLAYGIISIVHKLFKSN